MIFVGYGVQSTVHSLPKPWYIVCCIEYSTECSCILYRVNYSVYLQHQVLMYCMMYREQYTVYMQPPGVQSSVHSIIWCTEYNTRCTCTTWCKEFSTQCTSTNWCTKPNTQCTCRTWCTEFSTQFRCQLPGVQIMIPSVPAPPQLHWARASLG